MWPAVVIWANRKSRTKAVLSRQICSSRATSPRLQTKLTRLLGLLRSENYLLERGTSYISTYIRARGAVSKKLLGIPTVGSISPKNPAPTECILREKIIRRHVTDA